MSGSVKSDTKISSEFFYKDGYRIGRIAIIKFEDAQIFENIRYFLIFSDGRTPSVHDCDNVSFLSFGKFELDCTCAAGRRPDDQKVVGLQLNANGKTAIIDFVSKKLEYDNVVYDIEH